MISNNFTKLRKCYRYSSAATKLVGTKWTLEIGTELYIFAAVAADFLLAWNWSHPDKNQSLSCAKPEIVFSILVFGYYAICN